MRSGTVAFKTLRCIIEVAYIFASVKANPVKFLVWEKTTRKELQPIGVRGGESGGAAAPPGLKIFRANSVFRASAIVAQKSWMIKNIAIQ